MRSAIGSSSIMVAALATAALAVAACGSSNTDNNASAGASTNSAGSGQSSQALTAALDKLYKGTYTAPPTDSPAPAAGKSVYLVGTDMAFSAAANAVNGAQKAGKALGWKTTVVNGKSDPSAMLNGVRQALAAKADAIFLYAIDCPTVKAGLEAAKKAGIKIVAAESYDCDELKPGAPKLFDYVTTYAEGPLATWSKAWGGAQAAFIATKSGGKAKIINVVEPDYRATVVQDQGFRAEIAKCSGCQIVDTIKFVATDVGPKLQQRIQQSLLQHPEATATLAPYDSVLTSALAAGIRAAGRQGKLIVAGGEGTPEGVNLVRQGVSSAEIGIPTGWEGMGAMDNLNRLFNGQSVAPTGLGIQVLDKTHNMPASGGFAAPFDYEALYEKAWGAAK